MKKTKENKELMELDLWSIRHHHSWAFTFGRYICRKKENKDLAALTLRRRGFSDAEFWEGYEMEKLLQEAAAK